MGKCKHCTKSCVLGTDNSTYDVSNNFYMNRYGDCPMYRNRYIEHAVIIIGGLALMAVVLFM